MTTHITAQADRVTPYLTSSDTPDHVTDVVKAMMPDLIVARDMEAGYSRVRDKQTEYLPRHPAEEPENYRIRLERPAFFNSFARTTGGLTGMVFRRNPVLQDDIPEPMQEHWENIDNAGTHGDVFVKTIFHDEMVAGHAGILVDYPVAPPDLTLEQEQALGLRPFWRHILKENILSWRTATIHGQLVLTQLVLREPTAVPDGLYGDTILDRYRVLRRKVMVVPDGEDVIEVTWEVFEVKDGNAVSAGKGRYVGVTEIPFVPVYANYTGFLQSKPPLMDLAWLVITYYQTNSDMLNAAHIANTPIPVFTGVDVDETIKLGTNTSVKLPEGASAEWMETDGTAIGLTKDLLGDMRTEMSVLGLGILERRPMTAETATAKRIDRSEKDSQLSAAARSLQDGIEQALGYHAQFMGLEDENGHGGTVTLNSDYQELTLTPEQIRVYSDVVGKRELSKETFWDILLEGNALPASFRAEIEAARLEESEPEPEVIEVPVVPEIEPDVVPDVAEVVPE